MVKVMESIYRQLKGVRREEVATVEGRKTLVLDVGNDCRKRKRRRILLFALRMACWRLYATCAKTHIQPPPK
jgi:hypothetical protein